MIQRKSFQNSVANRRNILSRGWTGYPYKYKLSGERQHLSYESSAFLHTHKYKVTHTSNCHYTISSYRQKL
jgi:hypothetical protein